MVSCKQCISCRHYTGVLTCEAFPDGIPSEIVTCDFIHTEPYPGDHGIQFEPVDREEQP